MLYPRKSGWNLPTSSWDMVHTSTFGLKFGSLSPAVTLKIKSRSPKPNQLFIMSQCYIHANLLKIHPPVYEISCKQKSVTSTLTLMRWQKDPHQTHYVPLPFCGGHNYISIIYMHNMRYSFFFAWRPVASFMKGHMIVLSQIAHICH